MIVPKLKTDEVRGATNDPVTRQTIQTSYTTDDNGKEEEEEEEE